MYLPLTVSIMGGEVEVPATIVLGFSEELRGDQGTGRYYVDSVSSVELYSADEQYRTEVEAEVDKMECSYLDEKVKEFTEGL